MSMADICALVEADGRAIVERQTWGHLDAEVRRVYPGHVVFTHGVHGDITMIDWDLDDLDASPWLYRDMHDHFADLIIKRELQPGGVWRWEGTYVLQKNGVGRFRGKIRPMRLVHRFPGRAKR